MDRKLRVLVVDDETVLTDVISLELRQLDEYEVTTADSGTEAINVLKQAPIDIMLLDYRLGDITGLQVLQWINEQKMETPVIMMTAAGSDEVAVEAMKLGAYDYVRKERLELEHIPILLHGVYERYLFRKEKLAREAEEREQERKKAAIEMFQTTVRTIAHHVNNALAVFMLRSSVVERNLKKNFEQEKVEPILKLLLDLRRQAETIEAIVKSLVGISDVVYTRYAGDQEIIDIRSKLEENLEALKKQKIEA